MPSNVPVFVNTRDRVASLGKLISWLELAGFTRIVIVDNASTYPPLLDYLAQTPHEVIRLPENVGPHAPWQAGVIEQIVGSTGRYVETDPDVLPDPGCPLNVIDRFHELLDRYPETVKVGFGLRTDDLPRRYRHTDAVRGWEALFWEHQVEPGVYRAPIDTTFALYRAGVPFQMEPALRTGNPYVARHLPWYQNSARPSAEQRYYLQHAATDAINWDRERIAQKIADRARVDPSGRPPGWGSRLLSRLRP